ncbi:MULTISPECIES: IS66 family transposase [Methanothrix]|jgi:transposase|uniref:IS66 family transposase n=1 Tax=Methanothrix TaxID=2222 RepID=UPI0023EFDC1F|nr:IS66 family transposase [Methanothrix sp.]MCK9405299.1 IS66 family transposase [Methanothrix sp.]MCK9587313.1 IS66 family transposase [Methanothrix soehngenii]
MDESEIIRQLREQNELLRLENEMLKARIRELEARLAKYENAHTPPSLRRGRNLKKDKTNKGKPGQKVGHKGMTRPLAIPDSQVEVTADRCPDCGAKLNLPFRFESKVIEEIPEPQPVIVTEYKIAHYICPCCRKEVVARDANCPHEGKFGNNVIAQATLMRYEDRLPHRKIQDALKRIHGLALSPATIFDLTRRAGEAVRPEYDAILERIRGAPILYVDETGIHVQGEKHWIWTFTTPSETFFVIRKSRGTSVLIEVLTRRFKGIIVCDGWKPYARFTKNLQRCWAHLLRESKDIAEKFEEAIPLHKALKELYDLLTKALENDPPPEVRMTLWELAQEALRHWISKEYSIEKVRKFIGKISNGFDYWFTFILNPGVDPTNNRAERALRPHVVLRKILGTLRNRKGTAIHELIMTVLATWGQRGLDCLQMLTIRLAS